MNLDKLFAWIIGIVMMFAATGQLDELQSWVWRAQARVIYESRSSNWGSPRFFQEPTAKGSNFLKNKNTPHKFQGDGRSNSDL
jgi:hypothetical protein